MTALFSQKENRLVWRMLRLDLRCVVLVVALGVYGFFGSPTPAQFGVVEGIVGVSLLIAIGAQGIVRLFRLCRVRDFVARPLTSLWFSIGQCFLLYGVVWGVVHGIFEGATTQLIIRDVLAFLFLFLPLLLFPFLEDRRRAQAFVFGVVLVGIGFAFRAGMPVFSDFNFLVPIFRAHVSYIFDYDALYYLGNSSAVLFSALFLTGIGIACLTRGINLGYFVLFGVCFVLVGVLLVCVVATVQRASLGAYSVYFLLAVAVSMMRAPKRMMLVLCGGAVAGFVLSFSFFGELVYTHMTDAFHAVFLKNERVGVNMRLEEWGAVWQAITGSPLTFFFGRGWGALFSSPAVADIHVNFTHSLLSAMLLKLGVVGFVLCGVYIGTFVAGLLSVLKPAPLFVLAVMAPLFIDVFLYAAYKSLDFGLLLALIPLIMSHRGLLWESLEEVSFRSES